MLKRFEVEGFRAFKDRLIFDLTAHDYAFNANLVQNGIVKNAMVYGPNGIGKSCLGIALFDLLSHLTDTKPFNERYLREYQNLRRPPESLVSFKYVFEIEGEEIVYEYSKNAARELQCECLTVDGKPLIEWDYFHPERCNTSALDNLGLRIALADNKLSVVKYIRRNLPTGSLPTLEKMMAFVDGMLWYRSLSDGNTYAGFTNGYASCDDYIVREGKLKDFEEFLRANGIDYSLSHTVIDSKEHIVVTDQMTGRHALFENVASTGTGTLLLFYYWSIFAFDKLSLLFIDEFDAFFHYASAAQIIKQLNKSKFQVVLTSHNTYLMQNEFTRPDCCYIMSPGKIRNLPACTERELREAHNLEKMYQNGAFAE